MIDSLLRRLASYQLQDLRCMNCKQIKSDNLRVNCECSGEYMIEGGGGISGGKGEMGKRLAVTARVAEWHGLNTLAEIVQMMRSNI
jgi:DNA polymerase epsilon subunit 1